MLLRQATLIGACAAVLTACAGPSVQQTRDSWTGVESTPQASVAAQPAPPADPCADGPLGCRPAGFADIDGDGFPDAVGITTQGALTTVRVATAGGTYEYQASSPNEVAIDSRGVLIGAFGISRSRGADLVLHTEVGQGGPDRFVVIGWRDGALTAVPAPPDPGQPRSDSDTWYLMESHGKQQWVTCASGGSMTFNIQSAPTAEGIPVPGGGVLESNHWTFTGSEWSPEGSKNVPRSDFSYNFDAHTQAFQCEDQLQR